MTDHTPEKLDALQRDLRALSNHPESLYGEADAAITALRAQLAETDALIAAAYEVALNRVFMARIGEADTDLRCIISNIRALTPSTAREAYSAAIAAAERAGYEAGLQSAAHWIEGVPQSLPNRQEYAAHIRSLSAKKEGAQ